MQFSFGTSSQKGYRRTGESAEKGDQTDKRNGGYEERLEELNVFTLEKRRIRRDMSHMYKYIRGPYSELGVELFTFRSTLRTRGLYV